MSMASERTLLIVDDTPEDREIYRAFLCEEKDCLYRILEAEDATEGLAVCQREKVDCVLVDYQLPTTNGLTFMHRLQQQAGEDCPAVVMITGRGSESIAVEAMKAGAADYLIKADTNAASLFRATRNAIELRELNRQRRSSEAALRERESSYRLLADSIPDVVARYGPDRRHLYVNRAIREATGIDPSVIVGTTSAKHASSAEGLEAWNAALDAAFEGQDVSIDFQYPTPSGLRYYEARLTPERNQRGEVTSVLSIARDVTARRHQEAQLEARVRFEQQLIGIVSHDLRNPINAVLMSAAHLLRRDELDDRSVRIVARIQTSAERALRLIRDLLDFTQARLGGGLELELELRPLNLHAYARQVVDELQLAYPDRTIWVAHAGDAEGEFDQDRIDQILSNLVTNALKFSPPDSPVTVRTREQGEDAVAIEVHNHGTPIDPTRIPLLFEPLQRGVSGPDRADRSVGLGLYIVKSLVEAHGGRVEVSSSEEHGTAFTVSLPRRRAGAGAEAEEPQPRAP